MRFKLLAGLVAFSLAAPALADKLTFDHRLYPPLQQVLDSGRDDLINYNDKNPAYVTDLIVVRGTSLKSWTEAMIIIARKPDAKVPTQVEWTAELKRQAEAKCPSEFTTIAQDDNSITLERRSRSCPADYPSSALYRIVKGQTSLFLLGAMNRDGFSAEARSGWLALFGSARPE